jgi:ABC-type molybdate transport system permease subunit
MSIRKKLILILCGALMGFILIIPFGKEGIIGILQSIAGIFIGILGSIIYIWKRMTKCKLK